MGHKLGERRAEKVEEVRKAYEAMMPVEDIMKTTGLSRSFIYTVRKELGLDKRNAPVFHPDHPDEKRCPSCQTWKPVSSYGLDTKRNGGIRPYCFPCEREQSRSRRERNAAAYLWKSTKDSAVARGLTHTITPEDIVIPDVCPVLGIPLFFDEGRTNNSPSVDRLDNDRGYEPGNVIVVSFRANVLRRDATSDELRRLAAFYATP